LLIGELLTLVGSELLVVIGVLGARRMLVGILGAPIPEPEVLATGVEELRVVEAFPDALVTKPSKALGWLRGVTPPAPKELRSPPEEKALPPPVVPPSFDEGRG
jgi:hypothetical protein